MSCIHQQLIASGQEVSITKLCAWLGIPRSTAYYQPRQRQDRPLRADLVARIKALIERFPTFGVRRVWAWLKYRQRLVINRKTVHRIMKARGWGVYRRRSGKRPRVKAMRSVASHPDERWATDLALVDCGVDGWCVFAPVLDCCTRECLGWSLELTGRATTAERALEEALLTRFATLHGAPQGMALRHDNGLVFGSRQYRALVADYGLTQEYTTPYTPEQNGLCERFIKSFKEELCWIRNFRTIAHARLAVAAWIKHYNSERPHQSLAYQTPTQYHQTRCQQAT